MTDEIEKTNVFDEATVSEEMPTEAPKLEEESSVEEEWTPTISNESPKAKLERVGEKKEMNGKTLTIKSVFHTRPKTRKADGTAIPPKKTQDEKSEFYPGKLGIRFEEENIVEYYPNFKYYINDDGKVSSFAKIYRGGDNEVSKIFLLVVDRLGGEMEAISDQDVYDFLVGKKVKIETVSGTYMGKTWFRNNIVSIE